MYRSSFTGIEQSATRFNVIVTNMKKKPYDFLDQRKTEFELDFDEFKRMVAELHVSASDVIDRDQLYIPVYYFVKPRTDKFSPN